MSFADSGVTQDEILVPNLVEMHMAPPMSQILLSSTKLLILERRERQTERERVRERERERECVSLISGLWSFCVGSNRVLKEMGVIQSCLHLF